MYLEQDVFSKLLELLPVIQDTVLECLERELELFKHDSSRMLAERKGIMRFFHFLQRKWAIDTIYTLLILGELHLNEIRRTLEGVSSRTLTDRLTELEERRIIARRVHQGKPVRVTYSLTGFGRGLAALFVPVLLYGLSQRARAVLVACTL